MSTAEASRNLGAAIIQIGAVLPPDISVRFSCSTEWPDVLDMQLCGPDRYDRAEDLQAVAAALGFDPTGYTDMPCDGSVHRSWKAPWSGLTVRLVAILPPAAEVPGGGEPCG